MRKSLSFRLSTYLPVLASVTVTGTMFSVVVTGKLSRGGKVCDGCVAGGCEPAGGCDPLDAGCCGTAGRQRKSPTRNRAASDKRVIRITCVATILPRPGPGAGLFHRHHV